MRKRDDVNLYLKFERYYSKAKYFDDKKCMKVVEYLWVPFKDKKEAFKTFLYFNRLIKK